MLHLIWGFLLINVHLFYYKVCLIFGMRGTRVKGISTVEIFTIEIANVSEMEYTGTREGYAVRKSGLAVHSGLEKKVPEAADWWLWGISAGSDYHPSCREHGQRTPRRPRMIRQTHLWKFVLSTK